MNSLSIKTKFGWISALEQRNKIVKVKFAKYKNQPLDGAVALFSSFFKTGPQDYSRRMVRFSKNVFIFL